MICPTCKQEVWAMIVDQDNWGRPTGKASVCGECYNKFKAGLIALPSRLIVTQSLSSFQEDEEEETEEPENERLDKYERL